MMIPINTVPVLEKELKDLRRSIDHDYMLGIVKTYVDCNTEMIRTTHGYGTRCMCDD